MSAFRNDLVLNDVPYPEDVPGTTKVQNTVILSSRIKNCIIEPSAESCPSVYVNLVGSADIVGSPADLNKTFIITNTMDTSNSHIDAVNVVDYSFDKMTVNIKNFSSTEISDVKVGDVIYLDVKGFSPLCALSVVFNTGTGIVNKYVPSNPFVQDQLDKLTDNLVDQFTPASMYITSDCTIGLEIVDVSGAGVVYSSIIGTDTFDAFTTYAPASANVVNRPAAAGSTFTGELLTDGVSCLSLVVRDGFVTNIREKFLKFSEFVLNSRQNKGDTPASRNVIVLNNDGTHIVESIDSLMSSSATFDTAVKLTWTRYGGGGTPTITIGNGVPNAINFNPSVRANAASPPYSLSTFKLGVSNLQITINNVLNEAENGPISDDEYIPQFDLLRIDRAVEVTPEMKLDGLLKIVNEGASHIALYANMSDIPATIDNIRENVITVGGIGAANYVFNDVAYVGSPDATSTFGSILVVYLKPHSSVVFKIHPMSNDLHSDGDMNLTKLTYMEVIEGINNISPFPTTYYLHARPAPDPTGFEGIDNEIPPQDSSTGYVIGEVAGTGGFPYKERLLPMNEVLLAGSVSALNPTNGAVCSSNIPAESVLVMGGTSNTNVALRKQYYFKDINTLVGSPPLDPYNLPTGTRIGNAEFNASGLTAARSLTIQDKSGTLAFLSDVQAVKQSGSVITVNDTVLSTEVINIIAPSTAITVLFPATPVVGNTIDILFVNAATYNVTQGRNGNNLNGNATDIIATANYYIKWQFFGTVAGVNKGWVSVALGKQ